MKTKRVLIFLVLSILFSLPIHNAMAADALHRQIHGEQDILILGKVVSVSEDIARVEIFFTFPQSKLKPTGPIEIKDASLAFRDPLVQGKSYLLSLDKKSDYFVVKWNTHEIRGTTYADAKFVRIEYPDDLALQWFMNSGGKDTEFSFHGDKVFVGPTGEGIQIQDNSHATKKYLIPLGIVILLGVGFVKKRHS